MLEKIIMLVLFIIFMIGCSISFTLGGFRGLLFYVVIVVGICNIFFS